jgi:NAD(P)-dependent dehydrogenase (short-subunit alcohol dehydrogenase family)
MKHSQQPLGTGISPKATADDILEGLNLSGKNVIITGGNAGIGLEATRALSKAGASVTVASRHPERAAEALAGLERVETHRLDLSKPDSIETFVSDWLGAGRNLHLLINNAGIPVPQARQLDARGLEAQFSTNYLGHFQLTLGLLPALRASGQARVVNLSSGAQRYAQMNWDDLQFEKEYHPSRAYGQSKKAMVLFAVEFDRRFAAEGIRAYSVHPGIVVGTVLNDSVGKEAQRAMGLIDAKGHPIIAPEMGKKTPMQGASTIVFAAASPLLAGIGGVYLSDNDITPLNDEARPMSFEHPCTDAISHSLDPDAARRLWDLSEALIAR